ncbi:MAG: ABC transporter ATP-binding protein, partial [Anaerolineae bacterium]
LMNWETDLDENVGGHVGRMEGAVDFSHVTFGYQDGDDVLHDVELHIAPGQTLAVVGQTGAGKSTLTKLVNRTYDVRSGSVAVDGIDVRRWSLEGLRRQIAVIEQDPFLLSRSIADNISFGAVADTPEDVVKAARAAQAHEFIIDLPEGYDTVVGERGVTLSGGQRQRIAIARALLADPRIIILDDATSAIDSETEEAIQRAMWSVAEGRTTILITHRLSQIRWADAILVLRQGRVVDCGAHDELVTRCPAYGRLFRGRRGPGHRGTASLDDADLEEMKRGRV